MFESLPQYLHRWPTIVPIIAKFIVDVGDSAMATLDDAIQDSNHMMLVVWTAMTKKGTNDNPRLQFLKEMADHLYFQQENIEGMLLIEDVRCAAG